MLRVTANNYEDAQSCPFRSVLNKVGDKWSFLIFAVLEDGPRRFNEIKRLIGDISQRVLTKNLRDLEREGYVSRCVYPTNPPKVEYALTELGRSLLGPVTQFMNWAISAYPTIERSRREYDSARNDEPDSRTAPPLHRGPTA
jgi:DNA-binding HxlR family transcriptional regulator